MSNLEIRPEVPSDAAAISALLFSAFADHPHSNQSEPLIVDALRKDDALTVSLVGVIGGEVIGHVAFSPAAVGDEAGWYLLGPLAVLPKHQRGGAGSALVRAGLQALEYLAARGCVLVGDADYYSRFGFRTFPGLTYQGVPDEYVLALPLVATVPTGRIRANEAFALDVAGS